MRRQFRIKEISKFWVLIAEQNLWEFTERTENQFEWKLRWRFLAAAVSVKAKSSRMASFLKEEKKFY